MKRLLRHIAVYLLTATVFVATTGLSIHHLYCYCKGEMATSIFRPDEPCELTEKKSPSKNCCKGTTCSKPSDDKKHNCTDRTTEFVKLDAKYLPTSFDLKHFDFVAPQAVHSSFAEMVSTLTKNLLRWQQDLPPPPAGKQLLPWIQSYLC